MTILLSGPLSGKTTGLVEAFRQHLDAGIQPDQILCLSFFSTNAAAIRQALRPRAGDFLPWVTTLQRFESLLLRGYPRQAELPWRSREISPTARGLLLRQAWRTINGPLWREFGDAPGAIGELVRVIDWISQNRTRFHVADGELGQHELAWVYRAYLELCARHRLLTFQESSLRCLELLADPAVAEDVTARFPVLLVDDAHLARPDQLALIERLRGLARHFSATAWLDDERQHAAPELRHAAAFAHGWGEAQTRASVSAVPASLGFGGHVNPAVMAAARRLTGKPTATDSAFGGAAPIRVLVAFTVEDEAHAVAQAIIRALVEDETLRPEAVAVIGADPGLLPFVQRVLGEYGLPVEAQPPAARHMPLVRGGLLVLQRTLSGASAAIDRELFSMPFLALDAADRHVLSAEAEALAKPILGLTPEELLRLKLQPATLERLEAVRRALAGLHTSASANDVVERGLAALGAFAWLRGESAAGAGFSIEEQGRWLQAFRSWQSGLSELEAVMAIGQERPAELLGLAEAVADQIAVRGSATGVRLLEPGQVNGVHVQLAFVVGLSESAAPARRAELQLLAESDLAALFADGRLVVLPRARDHAAWIEREARALAALLTRGTKQLWLSTSRYSAAGEPQLPSPFFERLLGPDGEFDRDGNLVITRPGLWQLFESAATTGPEGLLPALGLGAAGQPAADEGTRLLLDHTFSASQVRMYLTCPLQFFYARVLGIETEGGLALDRGSLIHAVLYATLSAGRAGRDELRKRPRPPWMNSVKALHERALVVLDSAWSGQPADLPGGGRHQPELAWGERFGPELQAQAVRRWAGGIVKDWAEYEVEGWPEPLARRPVLLEATFAFELHGYRLTGRIDRVDEIQTPAGPIYEVIDYKTGTSNARDSMAVHLRKFLPEADKPPADFQLPLYALALLDGVAGIQGAPSALSLLNVEALERKKNGDYKAGACRTVQLSNGDSVDYQAGVVPIAALTGDIRQSIAGSLERMSASPYPAQPGNHCNYCSFRAACERGRMQAAAA
jgi:superfamily I DNA/RNA helicase